MSEVRNPGGRFRAFQGVSGACEQRTNKRWQVSVAIYGLASLRYPGRRNHSEVAGQVEEQSSRGRSLRCTARSYANPRSRPQSGKFADLQSRRSTTRITCRRKRAKPAVTGQVHAAVGRRFEPFLLVGEPVFASAQGSVVACLGIGIELGA